ncbi:MAG: homoserine kinase, partial [Calditrichota bacterium]
LELSTGDSRTVLPHQVNLATAVQQSANLGALVSGLAKGNYTLISRSLEDVLAEPFRKGLIPHFDEAKKVALTAGALGCSLSGSGPSIFALCASREVAEQVGRRIQEVYSRAGVAGTVYVSGINSTGGYILNGDKTS